MLNLCGGKVCRSTKDEICTTEELDQIITSGFGIRFAQMGMFESYRIAGGENGMRHFLDQFGPTQCLGLD